MKDDADFAINVPSDTTNHIQEMHIAVGHIICGIIEKECAPKVKALFLDRDGTVNVDYGYTYELEKFAFVDGIVDLCKKAQGKGYKLIVITNQSGVERGYYTIEQMDSFNKKMVEEFKKQGVEITDVYCCPYLDHPDRKPLPGMFLKARDRYNIDMEKSIAIGDKERDIVSAFNAGVKTGYLLSDKSVDSVGNVVNSLNLIEL